MIRKMTQRVVVDAGAGCVGVSRRPAWVGTLGRA